MSEGSSKWRLQGAVLVLACVTALAACGGDDDDEPVPAPRSTVEAAEASPLRERLDRLMARLLSERGLDRTVAECAIDRLAETVSDRELESAIAQIRKTGSAPPGVIEAAAAAGRACGRQ